MKPRFFRFSHVYNIWRQYVWGHISSYYERHKISYGGLIHWRNLSMSSLPASNDLTKLESWFFFFIDENNSAIADICYFFSISKVEMLPLFPRNRRKILWHPQWRIRPFYCQLYFINLGNLLFPFTKLILFDIYYPFLETL